MLVRSVRAIRSSLTSCLLRGGICSCAALAPSSQLGLSHAAEVEALQLPVALVILTPQGQQAWILWGYGATEGCFFERPSPSSCSWG